MLIQLINPYNIDLITYFNNKRSKNIKSISRSIKIVDPQKDEQDSLSDFY